MGMIGLLVALYPRKWREEYGEEFAALLEETRLTPGAVLDVLVQAGKLHAERHRRLTLVLISLLWSGCAEYLCVRGRLTANILWAPTTPARALALAATTGPWLALAAVTAARRCGRGGAAGRSAP
jgi:hypothetical protein